MDITDLASKEQLREWIEALGLVLVSYELWIEAWSCGVAESYVSS